MSTLTPARSPMAQRITPQDPATMLSSPTAGLGAGGSKPSRLPRLFSSPLKPSGIPVPAQSSSIAPLAKSALNGNGFRPAPSKAAAGLAASTTAAGPSALRKRKELDESVGPTNGPAKRAAPGTSSLAASTSAAGRKPPARGFVPSTTRKIAAAPRSISGPSLGRSTSTAPSSSTTLRKPIGRAVSAQAAPGRPGAGSSLGASTSRPQPSHAGLEAQVKQLVSQELTSMQALMRQDQQASAVATAHTQTLASQLATAEDQWREARRNLSSAGEELADARAKHAREMEAAEARWSKEVRERGYVEEDLRRAKEELEASRREVFELKSAISTQAATSVALTSQLTALQTVNATLEGTIQQQKLDVEHAEATKAAALARVEQVEEELRAAETVRRKLHNQVQELKGNIRVFARVRPALAHESSDPDALAEIEYEPANPEDPQQKITFVTRNQSAMGSARDTVVPFAFDKIFQPTAGQKEVFEEISLLAQSVCDGYNVCIFAYGQTGSGKSWTMEGGGTPDTAGMIPRAIEMMFRETEQLKDRGWVYKMQGQFLEIYNETINDLLGTGDFDTKKHEVKHGPNGKTTVTDVVNVPLDNASQVQRLLSTANRRRAVAATLMNERSSRSHSVFTLKVSGSNPLTGETCEGALNLVDLAGSERLNSSGAGSNTARMKETISINSSLSALKDVIEKLGQGETKHVPYRNSKLTYLLQTSLSGQSKTLMLCNLSPLAAHAPESLCSLRFAKLVNNTTLGTAKRHMGARSPA